MNEACGIIGESCHQADLALDQAFSAGVLSSGQNGPEGKCAPTAESVQYHNNLPRARKSRTLRKALDQLTTTIRLFEKLDNKLYPSEMYPLQGILATDHWFQKDLDLQETAENYLMDIRERVEQSLSLTTERMFPMKNTKTLGAISKNSSSDMRTQPELVSNNTLIPGMNANQGTKTPVPMHSQILHPFSEKEEKVTPAEVKSGVEKAAVWVEKQSMYQQDISGLQTNPKYQNPTNQKQQKNVRFNNQIPDFTTAYPLVAGFQPQNITSQDVSSGKHISQIQVPDQMTGPTTTYPPAARFQPQNMTSQGVRSGQYNSQAQVPDQMPGPTTPYPSASRVQPQNMISRGLPSVQHNNQAQVHIKGLDLPRPIL